MAVGIKLRNITHEIGTPDFFQAFFSTLSGNLEPQGWGTRFPVIMNQLYGGELPQFYAKGALAELEAIKAELATIPVDMVIWDIEDRSKAPPWGDDIADNITDLSNYFLTATGRDLLAMLQEMLENLLDKGGFVEIVSY